MTIKHILDLVSMLFFAMACCHFHRKKYAEGNACMLVAIYLEL